MSFYRQGGNEPQIKEALTGEPLESIAAKIQPDREASQQVMNECAPKLRELLTGK